MAKIEGYNKIVISVKMTDINPHLISYQVRYPHFY